jgi:hypothetical protein
MCPNLELVITDNLKLFHDTISTTVVSQRWMTLQYDHKQFIGMDYEEEGRRLFEGINSSGAWRQRKQQNQIVGQDNQ